MLASSRSQRSNGYGCQLLAMNKLLVVATTNARKLREMLPYLSK